MNLFPKTLHHPAARAAATAAALGLLLAAGTVRATVYRCTDAQGGVSYQAQPCADASPGRRLDADSRAATPPRDTPREAPPPDSRPAPGARGPATDPRADPHAAQRVLAPAAGPQGLANWAAGADVIVVSAYQFSSRTTQVHLNHPARPVLLVLSSHGATEWKVLPAPGTQLKGIVASSDGRRATVLAPPGVPVVPDELPYAYDSAGLPFRDLIAKLHARYGVEKVTALRGGYTLPELVPVTGPYPADAHLSLEGLRPELPRVRMGFDLLSIDGRRLAWTNTGPRDGKRYTGIVRGGGLRAAQNGAPAAIADGGEAYALEGNGGTLRWYPQGFGGPSKKVDWPDSLPPLSWGSGLAWDPRQGVLAIVSFGGEGYFYRYDTRQKKWLGARSLQNRDLLGLAYHPGTGGYVAVSDAGELLLFNDRGELDEVQPLAKLLPDLESTYDKGNSRLESLTVAADANAVALVNVRKGSVTHIWTYEPGSRKAQLTYKMVE